MATDDLVNLPPFHEHVKTMFEEILKKKFGNKTGADVKVNVGAEDALEVVIKPSRNTSLFELRKYFLENGFEAKLSDEGEIKIDGSGELFPSTIVNMHRAVMETPPDKSR